MRDCYYYFRTEALQFYQNETSKVFSSEIFKNNYYEEHLRTTASGALLVQTELWGLIDDIWRLHCVLIQKQPSKSCLENKYFDD